MKSESSPKSFKADLHCHSTCSDGTLDPIEILELAKKIGLQGLSITDHDTILAYPAALEKAKSLDLCLIPGIEFSSYHKHKSVHVLGYSFDYAHPSIQSLCEKHKIRRLDRNLKILDKLKTLGFVIDAEELFALSKATLGRPHIAYLMTQKGYVPDIATAFKLYLGDGKKCYVTGEDLPLEETLDTIKKAKGFAVLAHPHLYNSYRTVKKLLDLPFDGLECSYANMSSEQNEPWIKLAREKNLILTGGSDFHGDVKPNVHLGATTIGWESFSALLHS